MARTSAATAAAAPIPIGGDTFTVALKATEAAWVKARARQLGMKPGDLTRSVVASARGRSDEGRDRRGHRCEDRRRARGGRGVIRRAGTK